MQRLNTWAEQWRPVLDELPARLAGPAALSAGWHAEAVFVSGSDEDWALLWDEDDDGAPYVHYVGPSWL